MLWVLSLFLSLSMLVKLQFFSQYSVIYILEIGNNKQTWHIIISSLSTAQYNRSHAVVCGHNIVERMPSAECKNILDNYIGYEYGI